MEQSGETPFQPQNERKPLFLVYRVSLGNARANDFPSINPVTSTPSISTNMDPINKEIEEIESLELGKTFCYATIAKKHSAVRTI
jgi:hypothetical protein